MAGNIRHGYRRRTSGSSGSLTPIPDAVEPPAPRKPHPPNKKQHDLDMKDIADRVVAKERDINIKKQHLAAEVASNVPRHAALSDKIREADEKLRLASDALKNRNEELKRKIDEVNQTRSRTTYKTERQIDDTINRLEHQRTHQHFSAADELKIIKEIDKLRRSKQELKKFNKLISERDVLHSSLNNLRTTQQIHFGEKQKLVTEDRLLFDEERKHTTEMDALANDIFALQRRRTMMTRELEKCTAEWEAHIAANRKLKLMEQQSMRNTRNEGSHEPVIRDPYLGAKQTVSSLLMYLQQLTNWEDGTAESFPTASNANPVARPATPPPVPVVFEETPGYFLPKKYADRDNVISKVAGKGKKDKKKDKHKQIIHSGAAVAQFFSLDLIPPSTFGDIPASIEELQATKSDLEKRTLVRFASLDKTPKTSPTEEALPSFPDTDVTPKNSPTEETLPRFPGSEASSAVIGNAKEKTATNLETTDTKVPATDQSRPETVVAIRFKSNEDKSVASPFPSDGQECVQMGQMETGGASDVTDSVTSEPKLTTQRLSKLGLSLPVGKNALRPTFADISHDGKMLSTRELAYSVSESASDDDLSLPVPEVLIEEVLEKAVSVTTEAHSDQRHINKTDAPNVDVARANGHIGYGDGLLNPTGSDIITLNMYPETPPIDDTMLKRPTFIIAEKFD